MVNHSRRSIAFEESRQARPWRVLPLAVGAVIATLSVAALAGDLSRDLSKNRYAADIMKDAIDKSDIRLPKV